MPHVYDDSALHRMVQSLARQHELPPGSLLAFRELLETMRDTYERELLKVQMASSHEVQALIRTAHDALAEYYELPQTEHTSPTRWEALQLALVHAVLAQAEMMDRLMRSSLSR